MLNCTMGYASQKQDITQHSTFITQHSSLNIQHSTFNI
nr:MAG TPA: hypothetical protein [Caudoviricetes sp.]